MNEPLYLPTKTISLSMSKKSNHMGRVIRINTSFLKTEIPVFIMFRALGILSDYEIIHHVLYDIRRDKNKHILEELKACCDDASGVYTREDALEYILRNITGNMKNNKGGRSAVNTAGLRKLSKANKLRTKLANKKFNGE